MLNGSIRYLIAGIAAGLIIGFFFANAFSRAEMENRRLSNSVVKSEPPNSPSPQTSSNQNSDSDLSADELRQAIARADANPSDTALQRNLGIALYRYSGTQQNSAVLNDAVRMLERAEAKTPISDKEFFGVLGNAQFVLARQGDAARMLKARAAYQQVLKLNLKDVDVLVDLGLTYFYDQPVQVEKALQSYSQALAVNPSHERALENSIVACLRLEKVADAAQFLEKLKTVNPNNPAIPDLEVQLAQIQL